MRPNSTVPGRYLLAVTGDPLFEHGASNCSSTGQAISAQSRNTPTLSSEGSGGRPWSGCLAISKSRVTARWSAASSSRRPRSCRLSSPGTRPCWFLPDSVTRRRPSLGPLEHPLRSEDKSALRHLVIFKDDEPSIALLAVEPEHRLCHCCLLACVFRWGRAPSGHHPESHPALVGASSTPRDRQRGRVRTGARPSFQRAVTLALLRRRCCRITFQTRERAAGVVPGAPFSICGMRAWETPSRRAMSLCLSPSLRGARLRADCIPVPCYHGIFISIRSSQRRGVYRGFRVRATVLVGDLPVVTAEAQIDGVARGTGSDGLPRPANRGVADTRGLEKGYLAYPGKRIG